MPVQDLARSEVVTAHTDTAVSKLAEQMADERVGSVVITDDEMPIGIVTDRDLALRCVAEEADPTELSAENVMTENLQTIEQDAGFYDAVDQMSEHGVRRLPVIDDSDHLVGILTTDDLEELLADEHNELADVIRAQRPPYE